MLKKKIKCACGCGKEFYPNPRNNRKFANPECGNRARAVVRKCRYCDNVPPGKKKVCLAPECQEKMRANVREAKRLTAKARDDKIKTERLKKHPVFCVHCGAAFGLKDSLQRPACRKCAEWWKKEREIRKANRNDAANEKRKAENRQRKLLSGELEEAPTSTGEPFVARADDWSQEKFIEKLKKNKALNGYTCLHERCNVPTNGPYRFCEKHRKENFRIAEIVAHNGGEARSRRAFGGVQ